MKNELDPWEVGLAEQMKGKEFSFDPQAFADFENLLEAETLGHEPTPGTPEVTDEVMTAGGSSFTLPLTLLLIGLVCIAGWWFGLREEIPAMQEQHTSISSATVPPVSSPAPSPTLPAPAAAPTSSVALEMTTSGSLRKTSPTQSDASAITSIPNEVDGDVSVALDVPGTTEEAPLKKQRTYQVEYLPVLPSISVVASIQSNSIPLPEVQKPTPTTRKRDRKALFPDVLNKN